MAETFHASNLTELHDALARAGSGDTIALAPGDYGTLFLGASTKHPIGFPGAGVTITSADPNDPAVLRGLDLRGAENLSFDGLRFDYDAAPGTPIWSKPFSIESSRNITIRDSVFEGDLARGLSDADNGYGTGFGLSVRGSQDITIENNEVSGFFRGLVFGGSDDLVVRGNEIHELRMDGMNFSHVQGVVIEDNHIHSFRRSPTSDDHADFIQFWTNGGTRPSTDIVIRGNLLDIGAGDGTQSIFMRNDMVDRGLAGPEMFYQGVLIEGNTIYNAHAHGITVGETAGLVIRDNAVLHADANAAPGTQVATVEIPRISVAGASQDVTITGNVTAAIAGHDGQAGWQLRGNAFVQDQDAAAPGWYGDVFVASSWQTGLEGGHGFVPLPGGMIERLGAGPDWAQPGLQARFHVEAEGAALRIFDAGPSQLDGAPLPAGTHYLWQFPDGSTAEGARVAHAFPEGGRHDVTLTVTLPGGQGAQAGGQITLAGPELVALGSDGAFRVWDHGSEVVLEGAAPSGAIALGGAGAAAEIPRAHLSEIFSADSFEIRLTLQADAPGAGELFRLHGAFIASVNAKGELLFRQFTDDGEVRLLATGARLDDGAAHEVAIRLEGGMLRIAVDGADVAEAPVAGRMVNEATNAFSLGNPWGQANFDGTLSDFEISVNMADFEAAREGIPALPPEPTPEPTPEPELPPVAEVEPEPEPELPPVAEVEPEPEPELPPVAEVTPEPEPTPAVPQPGPNPGPNPGLSDLAGALGRLLQGLGQHEGTSQTGRAIFEAAADRLRILAENLQAADPAPDLPQTPALFASGLGTGWQEFQDSIARDRFEFLDDHVPTPEPLAG